MRPYSLFQAYAEYRVPLLEVLADMPEHQATPREVYAEFERRFRQFIPARDFQEMASRGVLRWTNRVAWERFRLIELGLMEGPRPGIWRITAAGLQWLLDHPTEVHIARSARGAGTQGNRGPRVPAQPRRAKPPREVRKAERADEDRLCLEILHREIKVVRDLLRGQGAAPSDERLCDLIQLCYTFGLYAEGRDLFALVDGRAVNEWLYERTRKLARICQLKASP